MHIRSIDIQNLGVFGSARLEFAPVDPDTPLSNVHVFVGAKGKTTLLRAIAMAAIGRMLHNSNYVPYGLVRRIKGAAEHAPCTISAAFSQLQGSRSVAVKSDCRLSAFREFYDHVAEISYAPVSVEKQLFNEKSTAAFIVGYGSPRMLTPASQSYLYNERGNNLRYQRVAGLFDDFMPLASPSTWLSRIKNKGQHKAVVDLINALLADGEIKLLAKPQDGEYLFESHGARLPITLMSNGDKAAIAWLSDLVCQLYLSSSAGQELQDQHGIVLVDEIELHLHPRWQRLIVDRLSETFPNLQFVLTTNSPLVAGCVPAANTYVISSSADGDATVAPSPDDVYGQSVDQILGSDLFGNTPPHNPHAVDELSAMTLKARHGDPKAARELMHMLSEGVKAPIAKKAPTKTRATAAKN